MDEAITARAIPGITTATAPTWAILWDHSLEPAALTLPQTHWIFDVPPHLPKSRLTERMFSQVHSDPDILLQRSKAIESGWLPGNSLYFASRMPSKKMGSDGTCWGHLGTRSGTSWDIAGTSWDNHRKAEARPGSRKARRKLRMAFAWPRVRVLRETPVNRAISSTENRWPSSSYLSM